MVTVEAVSVFASIFNEVVASTAFQRVAARAALVVTVVCYGKHWHLDII
ncbi:MAG: hypothetical protein K2X06_16975 [Burkholderiales bacterium]|nr:hypothetical protein [Burkholderiales bacterium]